MDAIASWFGTNASALDLLALAAAVGGAVCLLAYGVSLLVAGATDPVTRDWVYAVR